MLDGVVRALARSRRCVVVTGAGISVAAGIPDFRSLHGLYNVVPTRPGASASCATRGKDLFDVSVFREAQSTADFFAFIGDLKQRSDRADVTRAHRFIKQLDTRGKLLRCYTQNIDGLEARLPLAQYTETCADGKVVRLHGELDTVVCTRCGHACTFSMALQAEFLEGRTVPCEACEAHDRVREAAGKRSLGALGHLRPNIVLYNEPHAQGEAIARIAAADQRRRPDLLIVIGTSLKVIGIKMLIKDLAAKVHERPSGRVILINKEPLGKEWDAVFDYQLLGCADDMVQAI
ncbi:hypothetical protein CXG81DRAFT_9325, partial [Caulochytrium protostelioides]